MDTIDHVDVLFADHDGTYSSQPLLHQHGFEVQAFGSLRLLPLAVGAEARIGELSTTELRLGRQHHPA